MGGGPPMFLSVCVEYLLENESGNLVPYCLPKLRESEKIERNEIIRL
jgi:hypothetical protein